MSIYATILTRSVSFTYSTPHLCFDMFYIFCLLLNLLLELQMLLLLSFHLHTSFIIGWSITFTKWPLSVNIFSFLSLYFFSFGLSFSAWRSPFNLSCNAGLVVMNFSFHLSAQFSLFQLWRITPLGTVFLVVGIFPFLHFEYIVQFPYGLHCLFWKIRWQP